MSSSTTTFAELLRGLHTCSAARTWAKGKTAYQAWHECDRADWLLWFANALSLDYKLIRWARHKCQYASTRTQVEIVHSLIPWHLIEEKL